MGRPFAYVSLFLDDLQIAKIAEFPFEHRPRIEIFQLFRSAGAVLQLLRRIALDDQKPARLGARAACRAILSCDPPAD